MTLNEIQLRVYEDTGYGSAPSLVVATRVKDWINEGMTRILRNPALTELRQGTVTFDSVVSQSIYAVPQLFERIDVIVQASNQRRLEMMSRDVYRSADPGETSSGTPDHWVPVGIWPVRRQPAGTGVWAASSAAADTTQTVRVQGAISVGASAQYGLTQAQAAATLNGTTRVQIGTLTTYQQIQAWEISTGTVGAVTLYDAAVSGNILAEIPIGSTAIQYLMVRLWPTPSAVLTYTVDGQYVVPTLVNTTDIPSLPPSYHNLLVTYAKMREYERTGDARFKMVQDEFLRGEQQLKAFVQFPPDYRPVAGEPSGRLGYTNLAGGWYPADSSWP